MLATIAGLAPAAHAATARRSETEAAFDRELERVHALMRVGRWRTAKSLLQQALVRHDGQDYVVRRLAEVREDLQRCSFGTHHTPPQPESVVAGELVEYRPERGRIQLRYTARDADGRPSSFSSLSTPGDFVDGGEAWVHPLVWNGPHTIRIRGGALSGSRVLGVVAASSESESFMVAVSASAAAIYRITAEENELATEIVPIAVDEAFTLEIAVGQNDLRVELDGRRIVRANKPRTLFGQIGFSHFDDLEQVELTGLAELSWIERKIDAHNETARLEFDAGYDVMDDLPPWLRELDAPTGEEREETPFAGLAEEAADVLSLAEVFDAKEDYTGGLEYARSLDEGDAPAAVRSWLTCYFLAALERPAEALVPATETVRLAPHFFPGRRKHVELLRKAGDRAEWTNAGRELVAAFPDQPQAYEDLARVLLLDGDRQGARQVVVKAISRGVRSEGLQLVDELLARAAKGPVWQKRYSYSSNHYEIQSDISRELCFEAAEVLDTAYQRYSMRFGRVAAEQHERFPVFLFSGEAGYLLYSADIFGYLPVHTAGVYSPALGQLLVWNLPERKQMLATIRHEGFHQFLDQLVGPAPTWLHEGMAEYFELSQLERGHWVEGLPSPTHLAVLRGRSFRWSGLDEFLHMEPRTFYEDARRNYAQAWLWVHFLENSGIQNKRRITVLTDALRDGTSPHAAIERAFPQRERAGLEQAWRAHLGGL